MAEKEKKETVEVPMEMLTKIQEQMAENERKMVDMEAKNAGLEAMIAENSKAIGQGEQRIRERKTYEPKFRTVRIRKFPIGGDDTNLGYVIGWTNKGAYEEVDRTGVTPQIVNYLDVIFLGHEKTKEGKIKAEKIRLLDFLNKGQQVFCKIVEAKKVPRTEPTGEEIDVTTWDPQHGLIATGEKIDGFVTYSDIKYTVQIPGLDKPVEVDGEFVNA